MLVRLQHMSKTTDAGCDGLTYIKVGQTACRVMDVDVDVDVIADDRHFLSFFRLPMDWFQHRPPEEPGAATAELAVDPTADGERTLSRIRSLCTVAMTSAEGAAQTTHGDLARIDRLRFASARRMSLELAMTIADASCRDAGLRQIIELCMKANDTETLRILVHGIQSEAVREQLLMTYPALFR